MHVCVNMHVWIYQTKWFNQNQKDNLLLQNHIYYEKYQKAAFPKLNDKLLINYQWNFFLLKTSSHSERDFPPDK